MRPAVSIRFSSYVNKSARFNLNQFLSHKINSHSLQPQSTSTRCRIFQRVNISASCVPIKLCNSKRKGREQSRSTVRRQVKRCLSAHNITTIYFAFTGRSPFQDSTMSLLDTEIYSAHIPLVHLPSSPVQCQLFVVHRSVPLTLYSKRSNCVWITFGSTYVQGIVPQKLSALRGRKQETYMNKCVRKCYSAGRYRWQSHNSHS